MEGRVKSENERGHSIVDAVNDAIDKNYMIRFQYTEYSNKRRRVLKNNGEHYTVSP